LRTIEGLSARAFVMRKLDVISLTVELPELGLSQGDRGTIVHVHGDGEAFTVEFADPDDRPLGRYTLRPDQIRAACLPEEIIPIVDELLFDNHPLRAARTIRESTGLGVRQAGDLMYERYDHLRKVAPGRFSVSHEEYWSGWYS
jgi:hypothetical protein